MEHFLASNAISILLLFIILGFYLRGGKGGSHVKNIKTPMFEIALDGKEEQSVDCDHPLCHNNVSGQMKKMWERIDSGTEQIVKDCTTLNMLKEELDQIFVELKDLRVDQLKNTFYTRAYPKEERMVSGLKYVSKGGNHVTRKDVISFACENLLIYHAVVAVAPHLRIAEVEEHTA